MASDSEDRGTACTLEFAVQMTCQSCVDAVRTSLQGIAGIQSVEVQLENQMVLVQTTLPSQEVQALLEGTGRQAVLKGMGSGLLQNLGAAVAILGGPGPVQGVVRFLQLTPERCLIEGTIDGLQPGLHGLHVHQFGDLTRNCNSCGDHFNPDGMSHGGPQDSERPGEGDTQNSVVAAQPEHLCRSLQEALGTQSKLQIQSEGHRLWERASQRRPRWVLARDLSPVPHEPFPRAAHGTAAACPQSQREKASKTPATLLLKPQLGGDAWSSPHSAAPRRPGECPC
ncbi:copper chaperone for superoxide dismutase isoform X1 [Bubalus kerabau]|uniref:copper chaperone for superoxide dismutase isoform X1 n=2 Tax=Bubalus carabanensis TaxID=3119969 RepID=UPI00244E729B|nr:copper chaperone for superoxide dismutase isoform X1 [Bubalus carabanensis]